MPDLRSLCKRFIALPLLIGVSSLGAALPAHAQSCDDDCDWNRWMYVEECRTWAGPSVPWNPNNYCYDDCNDSYDACMNECYPPPPPPPPPTWTGWLNRDNPGFTGDWESLAEFRSDGTNICNGATPIGIECQTLSGVDWTAAGEVYKCQPNAGGICRNNDQPDWDCQDYQVRFLCP